MKFVNAQICRFLVMLDIFKLLSNMVNTSSVRVIMTFELSLRRKSFRKRRNKSVPTLSVEIKAEYNYRNMLSMQAIFSILYNPIFLIELLRSSFSVTYLHYQLSCFCFVDSICDINHLSNADMRLKLSLKNVCTSNNKQSA